MYCEINTTSIRQKYPAVAIWVINWRRNVSAYDLEYWGLGCVAPEGFGGNVPDYKIHKHDIIIACFSNWGRLRSERGTATAGEELRLLEKSWLQNTTGYRLIDYRMLTLSMGCCSGVPLVRELWLWVKNPLPSPPNPNTPQAGDWQTPDDLFVL